MVVQLAGPVIMAPIVLFPGILIAVLGVYIGNTYLKAQMSVKREMRLVFSRLYLIFPLIFNSNARAPVLAHFGAAIVGLSKSCLCYFSFVFDHSSNETSKQRRFVHIVHRNSSKRSRSNESTITPRLQEHHIT